MADEIQEIEKKEPAFAVFHGYGADGVTVERYWDGVPARDLAKAEWDAIENENVKKHLLETKLYELAKKAGK